MFTVGIVGPITPIGIGNHAEEFCVNISVGIHIAAMLVRRGFAPYCPHLDFQYIMTGLGVTAEELKKVSVEWIKRCDVVFALPFWEKSEGSKYELKVAQSMGKHVVFSVDELLTWAEAMKGGVIE